LIMGPACAVAIIVIPGLCHDNFALFFIEGLFIMCVLNTLRFFVLTSYTDPGVIPAISSRVITDLYPEAST